MSVAVEVLDEIRRLRHRVPAISGCLVATLDGLLIAHDVNADDASRFEPEALAALAAANLGLGQRIASAVRHSDVQETVVRSAGGGVAFYAAGPRALLAVVAPADANQERLAIEARLGAVRVAAIIEVLDVIDFTDLAPQATTDADIALGTGGYRSIGSRLDSAPEPGPAGLPRRRRP